MWVELGFRLRCDVTRRVFIYLSALRKSISCFFFHMKAQQFCCSADIGGKQNTQQLDDVI